MNPMVLVWIVFGCVFGVGLLAMRLRTALPEHHLSDETKDTVKIAMGLLATISALVLGLMVASAKSSYDAQKNDVVAAAAKFVMLDRMLAHYGPETIAPRALLRRSAEDMLERLWPGSASEPVQLDPSISPGDSLYAAVQSLTPQNEAERAFKAEAMTKAVELGEMRWLLYEQSSRSISTTLLVVLVCWLAILFISFGLFAPANGTAIAALMVSELSASGALFLILELDQPFSGIIRISSEPVQIALAHLEKTPLAKPQPHHPPITPHG